MSITLTTPFTLSGSVTENDPAGAVMGMNVDYFAGIITFTVRQGTVTGTPPNLNAGAYAPTITVTLDMTTGKWTDSTGKSGTVPPGSQLNQFINQLKADRNLSEGFMAGTSGIMPGTQVPW